MCRFLALRALEPVEPGPFFEAFARACRTSREYQGHGWGIAWADGGVWHASHGLEPVWDAAVPPAPASPLFLLHARSAFRNERIAIENNMPFVADGTAFAFNGELHGVRLRVPGGTGAWKLFHLYRRFARTVGGDGAAALRRLDAVTCARSSYVRAMNVVVSDGARVWVHTRFGEDPAYFTLWRTMFDRPAGAVSCVASDPLEFGEGGRASWTPVPNGATFELSAGASCSS